MSRLCIKIVLAGMIVCMLLAGCGRTEDTGNRDIENQIDLPIMFEEAVPAETEDISGGNLTVEDSMAEDPAPEDNLDAEYYYPETITETFETYGDILQGYREFAAYLIIDDIYAASEKDVFCPTDSYSWYCMQVELNLRLDREVPRDWSSFGYALEDLNGDGVDELILLLSNYEVNAIFTMVDGELRLVDAYWPRHMCAIYNDGTLYTLSSGGAADWFYRLETILPHSDELEVLEEYGCDYSDGYYKMVDGVACYIDEDELDQFLEAHAIFSDSSVSREITKNSGIEFLPLFE